MTVHILKGILLLNGLFLCVFGGDADEYQDECRVWKNITDTIMYNDKVPMNCQINSQCSGFDCSGLFSYNGPQTLGQQFSVKFCFGIVLQPCKSPLEINFYVESPDDPASNSYQKTIMNGTEFQLPGVHYEAYGSTADGFVIVTMDETRYMNNRYVKFGMYYKTRLMPFGLVETWPPDLGFRMMPETQIPVPQCNQNVVVPTHQPGTCTEYQPPSFTTIKPPAQTAECITNKLNQCTDKKNQICVSSPSDAPNTGTCQCEIGYYKHDGVNCVLIRHPVEPSAYPMPEHKCDPGHMLQCNQMENTACEPNVDDSTIGTCKCLPDFPWDPYTKSCKRLHSTSVPIIPEPVRTDDDDHSKNGNKGSNGEEDKKSNKVTMIVGICVGAVVVIMGVAAAAVIIRYKRHQARYSQHTMLLAEDDDDGVIDNDEPMVEA